MSYDDFRILINNKTELIKFIKDNVANLVGLGLEPEVIGSITDSDIHIIDERDIDGHKVWRYEIDAEKNSILSPDEYWIIDNGQNIYVNYDSDNNSVEKAFTAQNEMFGADYSNPFEGEQLIEFLNNLLAYGNHLAFQIQPGNPDNNAYFLMMVYIERFFDLIGRSLINDALKEIEGNHGYSSESTNMHLERLRKYLSEVSKEYNFNDTLDEEMKRLSREWRA